MAYMARVGMPFVYQSKVIHFHVVGVKGKLLSLKNLKLGKWALRRSVSR
jgi:hypothetical protein